MGAGWTKIDCFPEKLRQIETWLGRVPCLISGILRSDRNNNNITRDRVWLSGRVPPYHA